MTACGGDSERGQGAEPGADPCGPPTAVSGSPDADGDSAYGESITLVAYESFPTDPDDPVVEALATFTAETGIDVEILIAGDEAQTVAVRSIVFTS